MTNEPSSEFEAAEAAQSEPSPEPATAPTPEAPAEEPQAADEPVAEPAPVVAVVADEGETFVIASNSGRTRITVRLEPDVFTPDADGRPRMVRTGEGLITIVRDGQTVLAHPLMREAPLE